MRSENDARSRRLERLSRMQGYDVAPNEPDPRGWKVVNSERRPVGEVADLIVDAERMVATYLDVELDTRRFNLSGDDPHVLVPVGKAHAEGHKVVVDDIGSGWVSELREARAAHNSEFWDRWWHQRDRSTARLGPHVSRSTNPDVLGRVLDEVRPGETVRIPLVEEEIIVERRPIPKDETLRDDYAMNRAADEPPEPKR
jgi:sporulation protein YlmC with PRC-barrel domain